MCENYIQSLHTQAYANVLKANIDGLKRREKRSTTTTTASGAAGGRGGGRSGRGGGRGGVGDTAPKRKRKASTH